MQQLSRILLLVCVFCSSTVFLHAAEILSYLPANTLSFAVVRNAHMTNDKLVKFIDIFHEGLPSPLEIIQSMTGLSEGLDLSGDILIAFVPSTKPTGIPTPMFLLSVADYATFARAIQADETGEICRVTIAEEAVLVAKRDSFALVMNLEDRELMAQILAAEANPPRDIAKHKGWLEANDISVLVTTAGITHTKEYAERQLKEAKNPTSPVEADPPIANNMLSVGDELPFAEFYADKLKIAGLGLLFDDALNIRLRWKVELREPVEESFPDETSPENDKPLSGYSDETYAFVGGGRLPTRLSNVLPELFLAISRDLAFQDGRGNFTEKDWGDVKETYDLTLAPLRSVSSLLTPVVDGQPILSIYFARLTVDDSQKYLEGLKKAIDLSNEITSRSKGDIKINFKVTSTTIAEAKGIEVTCDFDEATGDGDNHIWQAYLTSAFGIDHKWTFHICAVDEQHLFFGMESKKKLGELIEAYRKGEASLESSPRAQTTLELVPGSAEWVMLLDPKGFVDLVQSAMKSLMVLGFVPQFPIYPAAAPLAMTLEGDKVDWQGEIVMPVEAAKAMSEFAKEVEKAFGQ